MSKELAAKKYLTISSNTAGPEPGVQSKYLYFTDGYCTLSISSIWLKRTVANSPRTDRKVARDRRLYYRNEELFLEKKNIPLVPSSVIDVIFCIYEENNSTAVACFLIMNKYWKNTAKPTFRMRDDDNVV